MFRADLHIHSRFSRATSPRLTVRNLAAWAGAKGIDVLATGDFTHPAWREELREALVQDGSTGLLRLKSPLSAGDAAREIPQLSGVPLREPQFILESEISSIYRKNGRVRKVHSLVYMPDLASADAFCTRLEAIGNLHSDGRPILGLDVKALLEMVLEIPGAHMIPAHIWTPWFSLFGSKSGFDSLEECFEDLSPHIFAAETGLSSDPDMNRCWSSLDHIRMVSSSDAHSGENLAREATLFEGPASYGGIFDALQGRGDAVRYAGTLEFFPEEGKYHLDGHRACGVVLEPEECMRLGNICPVCGKPLTIGVLHRVLDLADRRTPPSPGKDFTSLVPLPEILGEILHCGAKTQKVWQRYPRLLELFGPEMAILQETPEGDLSSHWPELGEAVRRMRAGQVMRRAGYDGQYGTIRLFGEDENKASLLERVPAARRRPAMREREACAPGTGHRSSPKPAFAFTAAQENAIAYRGGPVLVLAGPGTGKTRTLVGRIMRLLEEGNAPEDMAAVTFTRRAAEELHGRLAALLPQERIPRADTLHALALERWQGEKPVILSGEGALRAFLEANPGMEKKGAAKLFSALELGREQMDVPRELELPLDRYRQWKQKRGLADYTDLPESWLAELRTRNYGVPKPWKHLLVDEVQDLSPLQKALVQELVPADGSGFFGIGDPDQSIYSFRGADGGIENSLRARWPGLSVLPLDESHRSAEAVLRAGHAALMGRGAGRVLRSATGSSATLQWLRAPDAEREAAWIAERTAWLLGGTSHQEADQHAGVAGYHMESGSCSPGDIAVLCRIKALIPPIKAALERRGIPCAAPEAEAFWNESRTEKLLSAASVFQHRRMHAQREHALRDAERFPLLAATAPSEDAVPSMGEAWDSIPESAWDMGPRAVIGHAAALFDPLYAASTAFRQLCDAWKEHGGWEGLLRHVAFRRDLDAVRGHSEFVQVMTMHASKGLEFKAVFIPACEDGILPFRGADTLLDRQGSHAPIPDEEARLMYVGITRAAEAVFLSSAERRTLFGHALELAPSPLVPAGCFRPVRLARRSRTTASQLTLL